VARRLLCRFACVTYLVGESEDKILNRLHTQLIADAFRQFIQRRNVWQPAGVLLTTPGQTES
jgi:hypothetical protein